MFARREGYDGGDGEVRGADYVFAGSDRRLVVYAERILRAAFYSSSERTESILKYHRLAYDGEQGVRVELKETGNTTCDNGELPLGTIHMLKRWAGQGVELGDP